MGTAHSLPSSFLPSLRHTVLEWLFVLSKEFVLSNSFYKGSTGCVSHPLLPVSEINSSQKRRQWHPKSMPCLCDICGIDGDLWRNKMVDFPSACYKQTQAHGQQSSTKQAEGKLPLLRVGKVIE